MDFILPKYHLAFAKLHERAIAGKRGLLEFEVTGLSGTRRWLETHAAPLPDADGRVTKMLGITRDITEEKLSAQALQEKEESVRRLNAELETRVAERTAQLEAANSELEAFSYSVSHDLRAPLRGIDGYARMLHEDCGGQLDAECIRLIAVVRSEAKRMGRLIDDLLAFSRMGRKHLERVQIDMRALAQDAYDSVIDTFPETATHFKLGALPRALGDRSLLRQVFVNLIGNALKFSRNREAPVIEVGCIEESHETKFFIKDNGVGFDEQYEHKLFGVFQRLHSEAEFEGTGIGLALVKRIIQRHGGRVWASGKLNSGATFHFTLPNCENSDE
jgi:light-regulated signal transduction histidine kinase (bacteriophytochrome)